MTVHCLDNITKHIINIKKNYNFHNKQNNKTKCWILILRATFASQNFKQRHEIKYCQLQNIHQLHIYWAGNNQKLPTAEALQLIVQQAQTFTVQIIKLRKNKMTTRKAISTHKSSPFCSPPRQITSCWFY